MEKALIALCLVLCACDDAGNSLKVTPGGNGSGGGGSILAASEEQVLKTLPSVFNQFHRMAYASKSLLMSMSEPDGEVSTVEPNGAVVKGCPYDSDGTIEYVKSKDDTSREYTWDCVGETVVGTKKTTYSTEGVERVSLDCKAKDFQLTLNSRMTIRQRVNGKLIDTKYIHRRLNVDLYSDITPADKGTNGRHKLFWVPMQYVAKYTKNEAFIKASVKKTEPGYWRFGTKKNDKGENKVLIALEKAVNPNRLCSRLKRGSKVSMNGVSKGALFSLTRDFKTKSRMSVELSVEKDMILSKICGSQIESELKWNLVGKVGEKKGLKLQGGTITNELANKPQKTTCEADKNFNSPVNL